MPRIDGRHRGKRDYASTLPEDILATDDNFVGVFAVPFVTDVIDQADVITVAGEHVVALGSRKKPAEFSSSRLCRHA
jgi:hypothetical protein